MSTVTLILGESGTGKSTSMRNMDAASTLLIQAVAKPLPFRAAGWKLRSKENPTGNIIRTDDADSICSVLNRTQRDVIVLDDFQYILANEFMRRSHETGFGKFTDIGKNAWNILMQAAGLPEPKRVYILAHTDRTEDGRVKCKTIGKLLDEKITIEGLVTIVLRTIVRDGNYLFATKNNGSDTVKAPIGLFDNDLIDNDLAAVDAAIASFYSDDPLASAA